VQLTGSIRNLSGGGITVAQGNVYVTLGQPTNSVVAFNENTLAPVTLPAGAFSGLSMPRGIAYGTNKSQFYIANGDAKVNVYDSSGNALSVPGDFPEIYGPSGISFDSNDKTLWVANYVGAAIMQINRSAHFEGVAPLTLGVTQYNEDGTAAQTFNYSRQFVVPAVASLEPYAIAYCPAFGRTAAAVAVGFIPFYGGRTAVSQIGTYTTAGVLVFGPFGGTTTNPHALSCSSQGQIFVAADNGLLKYSVTGSKNGPASGTFAGLTAPIYGVFANY
jgi:hypothetical protein